MLRRTKIILLLFMLSPLSFSLDFSSYIKSNYIIQNNTLIPITFQKTPYGWYYQNPNSPHQIYLKDIISKQDSIYYKYKSIKLKLTPEFVKTENSFPEYSNPTKGTISPSKEIGLNNNQNSIIYKNTFNDIDIGIAADSKHFYEIVKINKPQLQDINIYFKFNTNADIYYKNKKGKFVKWTGETITTNNSIKIIHNTDKITINPPKIWDSNHTKIPAKITLTTINNQKYLIKSIPLNSTSSLSFPIYNDLDITWETDESVFNQATTYYTSISSLNSTHFVVAYKDSSGYGTSRIGHFTDSSIIWDTGESVFHPGGTEYVSVSSLNQTHFVVAYEGNSGYGTARVGHFDGSSIFWDTSESVFSTDTTDHISISSLNQTHFVVAYRDSPSSYYGTARVGHFDGSSIFWDTSESIFNSGSTDYTSVSSLNSTHFVVAYRDYSNSHYGTARVGHFIDFQITWDTGESVFHPGGTEYVSVSSLNQTHFVVAYRDNSNSGYGTARIGHFTGTQITWDSGESIFNSGYTRYISVSSLNSTTFVVAYEDDGNSGYGTARVGHFTGSSITWDTDESIFNSGGTEYTSVSSLNFIYFVVTYRDTSYYDHGTVRVGSIPDSTPPTTTISPDGHSWTNQDVSFTLSCTDSGSGCNQTYYKIINDGDSCGTTGYSTGTSGTVTCASGSTCQKRVCYYSTDNAGNTETTKQSNVFYIDKVGPESPSLYPENRSIIKDGSFSWSLVSDIGCGSVDKYQFELSDLPDFSSIVCALNTTENHTTCPVESGHYYYARVRANDTLGNWGNWTTVKIYVDIPGARHVVTISINDQGSETIPYSSWSDWLFLSSNLNHKYVCAKNGSFVTGLIFSGRTFKFLENKSTEYTITQSGDGNKVIVPLFSGSCSDINGKITLIEAGKFISAFSSFLSKGSGDIVYVILKLPYDIINDVYLGKGQHKLLIEKQGDSLIFKKI